MVLYMNRTSTWKRTCIRNIRLSKKAKPKRSDRVLSFLLSKQFFWLKESRGFSLDERHEFLGIYEVKGIDAYLIWIMTAQAERRTVAISSIKTFFLHFYLFNHISTVSVTFSVRSDLFPLSPSPTSKFRRKIAHLASPCTSSAFPRPCFDPLSRWAVPRRRRLRKQSPKFW